MPFSYSQIQTYRTCPKQYEYACVKKLDRPLSAGESFGTSVHNTLQKWGALEMASHSKDTTAHDDQLKLFVATEVTEKTQSLTADTLLKLWHESFFVEGYANRMDADFQRNVGIAALNHFFAWWEAEPREVVAIEKGFKVALPSSPDQIFSGRFDRVERMTGGLRIVDFKTGSVRDQKSVDADLQLSLYALAAKKLWDDPVVELVLLFLNEEGITERKTARNASQLQDAEKSMHLILDRINQGDFAADPSYEKCKRCPYRSVCPAAA